MESEKKAHDVVVIIGRGRLVNWLVGRLVASIYFPCRVVRGDELERNPRSALPLQKCAQAAGGHLERDRQTKRIGRHVRWF